jgi:hypothetical protein
VRVILEGSVFDPQDPLLVVRIFYFGLSLRHRIVIEDEVRYSAWLESMGAALAQDCHLSTDLSDAAEILNPSMHEIRVARIVQSDFSGKAIRLPLDEAVNMLERPFKIVVEDDESDSSFWLALCTPQQRDLIVERVKLGFLEFRHGGGLGKMKKLASALNSHPRARLMRLLHYFLFDSDALCPNSPSRSSRQLLECCAAIPSYQLKRRFMESYLPQNTLRAWAYSRAGERRRTFEAFAGLTREERYHYHMKRGLERDYKRLANGETRGTLFSTLPDPAKRALKRGFGENIGRQFEEGKVNEVDLRRDGAWAELNPVIAQVVAAAV